MPILKDQPYTFRSYFNEKIPVDELLPELGYSYSKERLVLDEYPGDLDLSYLLRDVDPIQQFVQLSNEQTRREMLIAPVIREVVLKTQATLRIEYSINVSPRLQGNLDYLLRSKQQVLVVEAKNEDLELGFTQLAAQLAAIDQWERTPGEQTTILGAVTTGRIWEFGICDRARKHITQDLNSYRVPNELGSLMRILVQRLL